MRSSHSLVRRRATRDPRRKFILFCEGKNTEPQYFLEIGRHYSDALIHIEVQRAAGVPETIARKAADYARSMRSGARSSFEDGDQVWAVFDRDKHPNYERALDICNANGVCVARSNPCFELWLILHYSTFERPLDHKAVQKHLETLCADYKRTRGKQVNCKQLLANIELAERRAEAQLKARVRERKPYDCPSTTVGLLTAAIRKASEKAKRR